MTMVMHDSLRLNDLVEKPDAAERRRGLRLVQNRPVKILDMAGGKYFGGQTRDVSSTGLRIELPAHATVRRGDWLSVHVGLSEAGHALANRRQMILAKVVWVKRGTAAGKPITAGLEFASSISARLHAA